MQIVEKKSYICGNMLYWRLGSTHIGKGVTRYISINQDINNFPDGYEKYRLPRLMFVLLNQRVFQQL
jgi:hypothetical protein